MTAIFFYKLLALAGVVQVGAVLNTTAYWHERHPMSQRTLNAIFWGSVGIAGILAATYLIAKQTL